MSELAGDGIDRLSRGGVACTYARHDDDPVLRLMAYALDVLTSVVPAFIAAYVLIDRSQEVGRLGPMVVKAEGPDAPAPDVLFERYVAVYGRHPAWKRQCTWPSPRVVTHEAVDQLPLLEAAGVDRQDLEMFWNGRGLALVLCRHDAVVAVIGLVRRADEPKFNADEVRFARDCHGFFEAAHVVAVPS